MCRKVGLTSSSYVDPDVHGISSHPGKADKETQFLRAPADPYSPSNPLPPSLAVHLCSVLNVEGTADIMPCHWSPTTQLYSPGGDTGKLQDLGGMKQSLKGLHWQKERGTHSCRKEECGGR